MTGPQSTEDDETVYLAVNRKTFDQLLERTLDHLRSAPDPDALLQQWYSLQLAATRIAVAPGTTTDSQAQITELLRINQSLQTTIERMNTQHVTFYGPGGKEMHPEWCPECRMTKVMDGVRKALDELDRHIDQPGTPPDVSNVCRRVARYLTQYQDWSAPVEPESLGLQEVRALISQYVKLDDVDKKYPWVSTIEGVKVLLGDLRSMAKTIKRRGLFYQAAEAKLIKLGQPITVEEREEFVRGYGGE